MFIKPEVCLVHLWVSHLSTRLDEFKNIEKKLINRKRIVEIGCGNGVLLNEFQKNYSTLGFEIGPQSETAKKNCLKYLKRIQILSYKKLDCIFQVDV